MTKYYIFRHGETKYSKFHLSYPRDSRLIEILPEGIPAIKKIGEYLKEIESDYNAVSEFDRCQTTIKIVSETSGKNFKKEARLNEFERESFSEFKNRVKSFVDEIGEKNYRNVVICTHGAVVAALKKLLTGKNIRIIDLPFYPKTGTILRIEGNKIEEIDFNSK
jgi:broad specificity phosphatase PhoE